MPKKILVISDYPKFHSTRPEAEIFIGLAQEGFDVNIMTYGEAPYVRHFKEAGIRHIDFHPEKKFSRKEIALIRSELKEGKYDALLLYNNYGIINGLQAARNLKLKRILYRGYAGNINWYDPISYFKFLHPKVDKIICNAEVVKEYIDAIPNFNKNKTVVIHKGHDLKWYQNVECYDIRTELGIPSSDFLMINICNNRTMKGIPYLLKAFNTITPRNDMHLLIVGKGMETEENLKIIADGGKKSQIHLLGFRKNALEILQASNLFVLSSIKGESNTKALIEAMALAKACVITDLKGNRHLLENQKSGLIVAKKDPKALARAMESLYENRDQCEQFGLNAQKRLKSEIHISKTIGQMKELLLGV